MSDSEIKNTHELVSPLPQTVEHLELIIEAERYLATRQAIWKSTKLIRRLIDALKLAVFVARETRQDEKNTDDLGGVSPTEVDAHPCLVPTGQLPHDATEIP